MPLHAPRHGLLAAASGLRGPVEVVDMTPFSVLRHGINWLETTSPILRKLILVASPFAVACYGAYVYVYQQFEVGALLDRVKSLFVGKIIIPHDHPLHEQVLAYFSKHRLASSSRTLTLHNLKSFYQPKAEDEEEESTQGGVNMEPQPLAFVPSVGSSKFVWQSHTLTLEREAPTEQKVPIDRYNDGSYMQQKVEGNLAISCLSVFGGTSIIKDFLHYVQANTIVTPTAKTTIFRVAKQSEGYEWDHRPVVKPIRPLDSVALEEDTRESLVKDIQNYLSPGSKNWYQRRGIPWRRGYLCYGPPGTGKTSFATSLAGEFKMNVYIISLSNPDLNDDALEALFDQLPSKCLVLLEDIDSAGIGREDMSERKKKKKSAFGKKKVTLAGLLNVIDGPTSREGRLLLMTSNAPDNLDPALIRPGRIDRRVLFGHATAEINRKLFSRIMGNLEDERLTTYTSDEIVCLAEQFADKIPVDALTPAEVSNFLLEHRGDPNAAVGKAEAWAQGLIEVKSQGKNVAAFAGEIGAEANGFDADGSSTKGRVDSAYGAMPNGKQGGASSESSESSSEEEGFGNQFQSPAGLQNGLLAAMGQGLPRGGGRGGNRGRGRGRGRHPSAGYPIPTGYTSATARFPPARVPRRMQRYLGG